MSAHLSLASPGNRVLCLWLLALLTACTHVTRCGKDAKTVFETPPQAPRYAMVAIKSYRGSHEALWNAATSMMVANPRLGRAAGGANPVFLAAKDDEPALAVGAYTFEGSGSVAEILRMLEAVEERLRPADAAPGAPPPLALELWWVQGVHGQYAGQTLPSPRILDAWWANDLFAIAASSRAVSAGERGLEDKVWLTRVAVMFEGNRGKGADPRIVGHSRAGQFDVKQQGDRFVYGQAARNEPDVIAFATELAFAADLHLERLREDEKFRGDSILDQAWRVREEYEARQLDWVEPVAVDLAQGAPIGERFARWMQAARSASEGSGLAARRVVIFDYAEQAIRGALIGARVPKAELPGPAGLEHNTHFDSDVEYDKSTLWLATGTLPVPKLDAPSAHE